MTLSVDPTVLYYIRAQGLSVIAFALFIGLGCAIVPLFSGTKIETRHLPWLVAGVVVLVVFTYSGIRTLAVAAPQLTLADDVLQVGDRSVRLDASTDISYLGSLDDLAIPAAGKRGYGAMPSAVDFPPRFSGGPTITVTAGGSSVSLQPLLYGPPAYIESARAEATAFVQRLLAHGTAGNARSWLASAFAPQAGQAAPPPSFKTFLIVFICICVPVFGLLGTAVAIGIKQRLSS